MATGTLKRSGLALAIAATCLVCTFAHSAELEIPPPLKPKDLSVHVNQPHCSRWTDECVNCTRGVNGEAPTCSNIGFACQPRAIRCLGADAPAGKPDDDGQK